MILFGSYFTVKHQKVFVCRPLILQWCVKLWLVQTWLYFQTLSLQARWKSGDFKSIFCCKSVMPSVGWESLMGAPTLSVASPPAGSLERNEQSSGTDPSLNLLMLFYSIRNMGYLIYWGVHFILFHHAHLNWCVVFSLCQSGSCHSHFLSRVLLSNCLPCQMQPNRKSFKTRKKQFLSCVEIFPSIFEWVILKGSPVFLFDCRWY